MANERAPAKGPWGVVAMLLALLLTLPAGIALYIEGAMFGLYVAPYQLTHNWVVLSLAGAFAVVWLAGVASSFKALEIPAQKTLGRSALMMYLLAAMVMGSVGVLHAILVWLFGGGR